MIRKTEFSISRIATRAAQLPVRLYRLLISPLTGPSCRFYPTCSSYALQALERHGLLKGLWLATMRILRCHPWCRAGCDPVPERFAWRDLFGYKGRRFPACNDHRN